MDWQAIYTWLQGNYVMLIIIVIILLLVFSRKIINSIKSMFVQEPEEQKYPDTKNWDNYLNGKHPVNQYGMDMPPSVFDQKHATEQKIQEIQNEGKMLVDEERQLDINYKEQKSQLIQRKQKACQRYKQWSEYLESINKMSESQQKIQQEMRQ